MFSFHKPKVYRSPTGCCICKAKSSSSRFTDSRKYEEDFVECFQLPSPRRGEICNACVLLVKRFKRLPPGSDRHWGHVVDARVGPGLKSMTKFKKKKEEKEVAAPPPEKFLKIMKKKSKKMREETLENEHRENSPVPSDDTSTPGSPLSYHSDVDEPLSDQDSKVRTIQQSRGQHTHQTRKSSNPCKRKAGSPDSTGFLQAGYWKSMKICCGLVYKGYNNELAVDLSTYKPCCKHSAKRVKLDVLPPPLLTVIPITIPATGAVVAAAATGESKVFSDNSSDSGYDDCSNLEKPSGMNAPPPSVSAPTEVSKNSPNVLNVEKNVLVVNGNCIKNNLNGFKPKNFVLNSAIKSNAIKLSPANLIKPNIVIIKQKNVSTNSCIVKSTGSVSNINQVQQAAN